MSGELSTLLLYRIPGRGLAQGALASGPNSELGLVIQM